MPLFLKQKALKLRIRYIKFGQKKAKKCNLRINKLFIKAMEINNRTYLYLAGLVVAAFMGGILSLMAYTQLLETNSGHYSQQEALQGLVRQASYGGPQNLDFTPVAKAVTPAVVHIKTFGNAQAMTSGNQMFDDMMRDFFGGPERRQDGDPDNQRLSSGSGVIIEANGFIVTNNHVIDGAEKIVVALDNKKEYDAKLIGTDPTTDLALLKIEAERLPFLGYGNSDAVQIGEWVLAVGNPFDLTSTVTAGIVSAKARSINILRRADGMGVESFIQTDAAVNPGNSGGALVNLKGELIGINTAIATQTGSYSGYSFAVPAAIARKVVQDLKEFGSVQRGLLGVTIKEVTPEIATKLKMSEIKGVYVESLTAQGAAKSAGIVAGDLILSIDGQPVNSVPELQESVARHRPGDVVKVKLLRDSETVDLDVKLKNKDGNTDIVQQTTEENNTFLSNVGAEFREMTDEEKQKHSTGGVVVTRLLEGSKLKESNIPIGFIITHVEKEKVSSVSELRTALADRTGGLLLEGITQEGRKLFFAIGL